MKCLFSCWKNISTLEEKFHISAQPGNIYPLFIMYNVPSIFFSQKMVSISLLSDLSFSTILDVDANLILRQNPWWSNFNFSGQKPLYQNNFKHIAFFFTLFKGYKCNKLYEKTPKKRFWLEPKKPLNFKSLKLGKMKSYAWRFYLCFLKSRENWTLFSWAPVRNCLWCYYRLLITSVALKKV